MQIKLLRASLAVPSARSDVATRFIAKIFSGIDLIPDTMTAHWRHRDPSAAPDMLITSGRFRSSSKTEPAIDTHRYRHAPTV
jgi:hypothetical protein